LYTLPGDDL